MAEADFARPADGPSGHEGECRPVEDLLASHDWSETPLAPPDRWSISLRTTVATMVRANAQVALLWGPEFAMLYNDAFAKAIAGKHPHSLGRPAREIWADLWDELRPLVERVRSTGESYSAKDRAFSIRRNGRQQTVYFDVSYSTVPDDDGSVGGLLCIVSDTTQRVLAERRLKESERRFRALTRATADVIYQLNADWTELRSIDGQPPPRTSPSATDWMDDFILPEDQPAVRAAIDKAVARGEPFQLEHRIRLAKGSIGWTFSLAVPIVDASGKIVEWFGAASDVTERHRTSEHLELIASELNHRVKNNLAMVQAIAGQTFRTSDSIDQAGERFAARLVALAQANDLLKGERWAGASLREAVEQAMAVYQQEEGRISASGPEVAIPPRLAMTLVLALHELSTNAVKYGAWSNDTGRVAIAWSTYRTGEGTERLRIEWREERGPRVETPQRRGFGSRLIEQALAGEVNGQATLFFDEAGLRCLVDAPLPRLQRKG